MRIDSVKKLSVAVQMDPIEKINITGDSTFALMLEAQARGHELFYYTPDTLACGTALFRHSQQRSNCAMSKAIT